MTNKKMLGVKSVMRDSLELLFVFCNDDMTLNISVKLTMYVCIFKMVFDISYTYSGIIPIILQIMKNIKFTSEMKIQGPLDIHFDEISTSIRLRIAFIFGGPLINRFYYI